MQPTPIDSHQAKIILEAALLSSAEPLSIAQLGRLFEEALNAETLRRLLDELRDDWQGRAVELVAVASGWRFQTRAQFQAVLERLGVQRPPKYSRAVMETLAIIAYRQPVTRGDIEEIRGVTVASPILKALEVRGWIEPLGHREAPGRPMLYGTTKRFLDDLSLRSLGELPALDDLGTLLERVEVPAEAVEPPAVAVIDEASEAGPDAGEASESEEMH